MKLIAFLLLIIAIVNASLIPAAKLGKRIVTNEPSLLKIEFRGTCAHFESFRPGITVNSLSVATGTPTSCLPINATTRQDINDLEGHYVCSDVQYSRSIIDITEVFNATNGDTYYTTIPYVLGFYGHTAPFRVVGATAYRSPACIARPNYCDPSGLLHDIYSCNNNPVTTQKGWVLNKSPVYLSPAGQAALSPCRDVQLSCCPYVTYNATTPTGICGLTDTTNNELFHLEEQENHHQNNDYERQSHKKNQN
jgi:hypothetical protein